MKLTKQELARVVNGKTSQALGDVGFSGVEFDSRRVLNDQLFICLRGEKTHGHEFLDTSFKLGASLALVENQALLTSHPLSDRLICVDDTLRAFHDLAKYFRNQFNAPVLAITGSVGKTTVKTFAASILSQFGIGSASRGSFNNHVGVPYTICNAQIDDKWLVLEMGMNHKGELSLLTSIGKPDVALITAIAPVHIEFFANVEEIAQAKLEILQGLTPKGQVILNGDDELLVSEFHKSGHKQTPIYFGIKEESKARLINFSSKDIGQIELCFSLFSENITSKIKALGKHTAFNALAAALAAKTLIPEISSCQIIAGLSAYSPADHRLSVLTLKDGRKIIDDSYNSNPIAVKACLQMILEQKNLGSKIAVVLGDMAELGNKSEFFHEEVGHAVEEIAPSLVITVGLLSKLIAKITARAGIPTFEAASPEEAAKILLGEKFDIALIKGSRIAALDKTVEIIKSTDEQKQE